MTQQTSEHIHRAALTSLIEPGDARVALILAHCGAEEGLQRIIGGQAGEKLRLRVTAQLGSETPHERGKRLLVAAGECGQRLVIPHDAEWAHSLGDLDHLDATENASSPYALWVRGPAHLSTVASQSVAMVGARSATGYGMHVARELAYGLAERSWCVVSGAAYGIDAAAHRGACVANGSTVAVLATGADVAYPRRNEALLNHIAQTGAIVSEWPCKTGPKRHRFLTRNRIIAALTGGTVVVEAALRSGARLTLRRAMELSRAAMAVPGPVTSTFSVGTHQLIRQWRAELVTSATDILDLVAPYEADAELPVPAAQDHARVNTSYDALSTAAQSVLEALAERGALRIEELATCREEGREALNAAVDELLGRQFVQQNSSQQFSITPDGGRALRQHTPLPPEVRA